MHRRQSRLDLSDVIQSFRSAKITEKELMIGRNNIIYMTTRRRIPLSTSATTPGRADPDPGLAHVQGDGETRAQGHRHDADVWESALRRMYELLDALVAWRVSFANGTEGDKALSAIGRAELLEVRTILDTSIHNIKSAIDDIERQRPIQ
jgi:hypothetical protein